MSETTPAVKERPKRMTLSDVLELVLTRSSRNRPQVTIGRTAAGVTTWTVDISAGEDETADDAERRAVAIHDRLLRKYPAPSDHEQAEVTLTRNAKGDTQIAVSAKTTDAEPSLVKLEAAVRKVYDVTRQNYPMGDGLTARPGSVK